MGAVDILEKIGIEENITIKYVVIPQSSGKKLI